MSAPSTDSIQSAVSRGRLFHVVVLSAVGLAVELLLIRWLDAEVRALAYFKNLALIAAFLGLGLGYALGGRKPRLVPYAAILIALLLGLAAFLGSDAGTVLQAGPTAPEANLGVRSASSPVELLTFALVVAFAFFLTVLAMIPIGQLTAEYLEGIPPVPAYSANILGSLLGVVAMFAFSMVSTPPWITAAVCFAVLIPYLWKERSMRIASVTTAVFAIVAMASLDFRPDQRTVWSPYNKIEVSRLPLEVTADGTGPDAWLLRVQNLYYQHIIDLSPSTVQRWGHLKNVQKALWEYDFPYRYAQKPRRVLILGAGTGNDVAAALRAGAESVDAVEIDPRIVDLGRDLHGERPYQDPRVRLIVDDARAFLKRPGEPYDLIVFGLLDAHTSFYSSLTGGIRLDNYVYTVESFRHALARLEQPGGMLALSFYVEQPWIATRMAAMMELAAGEKPLVAQIASNTFTFIAGPAAPQPGGPLTKGLAPGFVATYPPGPLSTDDWPFIYLQGRRVPPMIVAAGIAILLITGIVVFLFFRGETSFVRHYFFLGAGFLLLETRTIAQLALLYGTTWRVSAIAIAAILGVILVANLIVLRSPSMPRGWLYPALFLALIANYLVPPASALGGGAAAVLGVTALLALPVLFAAFIFSTSIARETALAPVLASNLTGAVLGGLLENASLLFGIAALNLLAVALYALSIRRSRGVTSAV